jgi:hypothetical protein
VALHREAVLGAWRHTGSDGSVLPLHLRTDVQIAGGDGVWPGRRWAFDGRTQKWQVGVRLVKPLD